MFDWSMYLELARELAQQTHEQHGRAAISRAYYAAFNHAKLFVIRKTDIPIPDDGRAHEEVPRKLRSLGKQYVGLAAKLEQLKYLRTWADYVRGPKTNLAGEVEKALAHAKAIIDRLQ